MRYFLLAICIFISLQNASSQTYEVGVVYGGTNFVGDVGSASFVNPMDYISNDKISYGIIMKWNRSPRHAFRFTALSMNTFASDLRAKEPRRLMRGLDFKSTITELSLGLEFNFFEWDLHSIKRPLFTPYIYAGPTYFFTNEFKINTLNQLEKSGDVSTFAIPAVFGMKVTLGRHWVLGAEFGARYTLADNLDGSESEILTFGNSNMNDWYMFSGFTLTYTFGRMPCYCNF